MTELSIFVSGPLYSSGLLDQNVKRAIDTAAMLTAMGLDEGVVIHTFVPHASVLSRQLVAPRSEQEAQAWCDYWLRMCDALWRLGGVSNGTDHEVKIALASGISVLHDKTDFYDWLSDSK